MRLGLALVLALTACSKKQESPPAPTPGPIAKASVVPSASASAPPARAVKKLAPESVTASSEYDKPGEKHLALEAFDGDISTAWSESVKGPGTGEWLEAKLRAPRHLRKVRIVPGFEGVSATAGDLFVANAHVKTLRIRFDDDASKDIVKPIGENDRSVVIDVDRVATKVRFVADEVHPGKKWEDLAVAEIELWGDDEDGGSGMKPPALAALDAQLAKMDSDGWKASSPEPAKLLASLGFPPSLLKTIPYARVDTAMRTQRQLDDDAGDESIIQLSVFNQGDAENKTFYLYFWAFLDDDAHGNDILGRRTQMTIACKTGDEPEPEDAKPSRPPRGDLAKLETKKLHDGKTDDVLVKWTSTTSCIDKVAGSKGAFIATLARGAVDIVSSWSAPFDDQKPALSFDVFGEPPVTVEVTHDGATQSKLVFDPAAFRYH